MINEIKQAWNSYWFTPADGRVIGRVRLAILVVVAIWFASFFSSASYWFCAEGVLNTQASARILDFAQASRWQRWSPLWLTDSIVAYYAALAAGVLLATIAAVGLLGRWVYLALIAIVITWVHRIIWLSGPAEPLLVPLLIYCSIAPVRNRLHQAAEGTVWTNNLALRLVQTHLWIVLAAGFFSQLANLTWWRGEGLWWLAASGRSQLISLPVLGDHPLLINFFTHSILALEGVALLALLQKPFRPIGVAAGLLYCLSMLVFWNQPIYAALLAIGMCSFIPANGESAQ